MTAASSPTRRRNKIKAGGRRNLELLDRMSLRTEEQIAQADKEPASAAERKTRVEEAITLRTQIVTANQNEIAGQERRRQDALGKGTARNRQAHGYRAT